jgi:hypothetical protein
MSEIAPATGSENNACWHSRQRCRETFASRACPWTGNGAPRTRSVLEVAQNRRLRCLLLRRRSWEYGPCNCPANDDKDEGDSKKSSHASVCIHVAQPSKPPRGTLISVRHITLLFFMIALDDTAEDGKTNGTATGSDFAAVFKRPGSTRQRAL